MYNTNHVLEIQLCTINELIEVFNILSPVKEVIYTITHCGFFFITFMLNKTAIKTYSVTQCSKELFMFRKKSNQIKTDSLNTPPQVTRYIFE